MVYKSAEQRLAETHLCALLAPHQPAQPLEGGVNLRVRALMPIPASWPLKKKRAAQLGQIPHTAKPDLDNLVKHLKDCLTQMIFWRDDKQVVRLEAEKIYTVDSPGWEIQLNEV